MSLPSSSLTRQLAAADAGVELDEVRVARLPDGTDPDELIRDAPDAWREAIRTAAPIVDYLIDFHARSADMRTHRRTSAVHRPDPADASDGRANPVLRDGYLQRLRQVSGVEERVLLESLHRAPEPARGGSAGGGAGESRDHGGIGAWLTGCIRPESRAPRDRPGGARPPSLSPLGPRDA